MSILTQAEAYLDGGLSVFPIRLDGSKAPVVSWTPYRQRGATRDELQEWFGTHGYGIGIVGGPISGGLEILDFDDRAQFGAWVDKVTRAARERQLSWPELPVVQTPDSGAHIYYRHSGPQQGSRKLALDEQQETLIETRGHGGYVVAPGSPPACHPSGRCYTVRAGDLGNVPLIDTEIRALFFSLAESLDRSPTPEFRPSVRTIGYSPVIDGDRPGDLYNAKASWETLLLRHGWTMIKTQGQTSHWRRPGKTQGSPSATLNHYGSDCLHVFSSNCAPLQPHYAYTKFAVLALLDYHGDFQEAARDLYAKGYRVEKHHAPGGSMGTISRILTERMVYTR